MQFQKKAKVILILMSFLMPLSDGARSQSTSLGGNTKPLPQTSSSAKLNNAADELINALQNKGLSAQAIELSSFAWECHFDPSCRAEVLSDPRLKTWAAVEAFFAAPLIAEFLFTAEAVALIRTARLIRKLPPVKNINQEIPSEILLPGGLPIGRPGTSPEIRELVGGTSEAEKWFARLTKGGVDVSPSDHPGQMFRMPDGGYIGYRPTSTSGPPTIDVNIPGVNITKLKFLGG
jgi:hypothetical protein